MEASSPNRMTLRSETGHESVVIAANMDTLAEVLETMERFLRASGFHFDGELDIINELDPEFRSPRRQSEEGEQ